MRRAACLDEVSGIPMSAPLVVDDQQPWRSASRDAKGLEIGA